MNSIDEQAKPSRISLIAALSATDRGLGKDGQLLWRIPDDMKRFKELTTGHPVIMGRKTWESLPEKFRPLADRTNIVVTRQPGYEAAGAIVVHSLEDARAAAVRAPGAEELFVMGGGELYREMLPLANRLYLTVIKGEKEADAFFPAYESEFTRVVAEERSEWNGIPYTWATLERWG